MKSILLVLVTVLAFLPSAHAETDATLGRGGDAFCASLDLFFAGVKKRYCDSQKYYTGDQVCEDLYDRASIEDNEAYLKFCQFSFSHTTPGTLWGTGVRRPRYYSDKVRLNLFKACIAGQSGRSVFKGKSQECSQVELKASVRQGQYEPEFTFVHTCMKNGKITETLLESKDFRLQPASRESNRLVFQFRHLRRHTELAEGDVSSATVECHKYRMGFEMSRLYESYDSYREEETTYEKHDMSLLLRSR